ncbi:hypothetical protein LIER_38706 [Lithospermum erythrorhizon]|uniref:Uncharacterized protein n=1 Tax=Lithospermum erythrorhizon TaxID=34254 RepID=A0AAV3Q8Y2_LITER
MDNPVPLAMIPPSPDGVHQFPDSTDDSTGESSDSLTQNTHHSNDSVPLFAQDLIQWLGKDSADWIAYMVHLSNILNLIVQNIIDIHLN